MEIQFNNTLNSINDVKKIIEAVITERFLNPSFMPYFRGHGKDSYKLVPNIARNSKSNIQNKEEDLLNKLRREKDQLCFHSEPLFTNKQNDWNLLIQAQHIGQETRLLDWSMKWGIALWFAVQNEEHHNFDGALYLLKAPRGIIIDNTDKNGNFYNKDLNYLERTFLINAPTYSSKPQNISMSRMMRQWGVFTISPFELVDHSLDSQKLLCDKIQKYIIPAKYKKTIKTELAEMGILTDFVLLSL